MYKKTTVLLLLLLTFAACQKETKTNKIVIEKRYSLDLPDFLSKATTLNDEASLQYQNLFKEFYVVVIDEEKDDIHMMIDDGYFENNPSKDVLGYANIIFNNTKNAYQVKNETTLEAKTVNGYAVRTVFFETRVDNIDIFFHFAFVEGKERYYQIMLWTLLKNKEQYLEEMEKIVDSFTEMEQRKKKQ